MLTQQEIPVSPRNTTEGYGILIPFPLTHVWAGSDTPAAEECVDDMKNSADLLWRARLSPGFPYPYYSLLRPVDVQLPHFMRRASEGTQQAQSRQQIITCMISRATEPRFLHICPFEPQNKDKSL